MVRFNIEHEWNHTDLLPRLQIKQATSSSWVTVSVKFCSNLQPAATVNTVSDARSCHWRRLQTLTVSLLWDKERPECDVERCMVRSALRVCGRCRWHQRGLQTASDRGTRHGATHTHTHRQTYTQTQREYDHLLWKANRKPHPRFWMAPVSIILSDL